MNLADFLLQRFAEDERVLDTEHNFTHWASPRVMAECAAKRSIVAHAKRSAEVGPAATEGVWFLVLRYLAEPYADHPDYDERWRP